MIKDDFMATMRERFRLADEADNDLRLEALDDIRFAYEPGNQWDEAQKKKRKNRPCYEFNRLRQAIRQVTGEQRKNRPQIKVRAQEDSDKKTADTLQGLIRNIELVSNAERAYDTAFEFSVAGGFGAWRITTDYCHDTAFEQEVRIRDIRNPFTVTFDPAANEWDRRDALYAFVTEKISKESFKQRWPKAEMVDFEDTSLDDDWFASESEIRIAEYWVKEPITKTVCLLSDGQTVDKEQFAPVADEYAKAGVTVVKERQVKTHKVMQYLVSGKEVLEGPTEWAGKYIPIVPVWGDLVNIEGRDYFSGMVRHSKDSQKLYNFNRTTAVELVGKSPKAPYLVTPTQIKGLQSHWNAANADDAPYLPYNPDPEAPGGKPMREPPPQVPTGLVSMLQLDGEDLKATTGIFDASLGARSNETSGRAIIARQQEGDTANFEYVDNLSRSIRYCGEILVDLIPKIYDTQRMIRVLGEDNSEQYVTLNQEVQDEQTGETVRVNDLSHGRYDVTVTVGPSYATQRMEMADTLLKLTQNNPQVGVAVTDLIVRSLDMPGGDEVQKRIRRMMIQQGVIPPTQEDMEEAAKMPKQDPSPQQILEQRNAEAEVQAKEIDNAKAMKELQAEPPQDFTPQLEGMRLQIEQGKQELEGQRLQFERETKLTIEQMKADQDKWEAELKAATEKYKADLEAQTRLQIAEIEQANKAAMQQEQQSATMFTELQRIAHEAQNGLQKAREERQEEGREQTLAALLEGLGTSITGLRSVMEQQGKPRTVTVMRGADGELVGGSVQ